MKHIGTVTKYYPFVDSKIRDTLDALLDESQNFHDFIILLSHELSNTSSPEILAHIGAVLSNDVQNLEANNRIGDKYGSLLCVKPWITRLDSETKLNAINELIDSSPPDIILFQAYLGKTAKLYLVPQAYDSLQAAKDILETNLEMDCFIADFFMHEIMLRRYEGDAETVYNLGVEALKKSKECDDILSEMYVLTQQTEFLRASTPRL